MMRLKGVSVLSEKHSLEWFELSTATRRQNASVREYNIRGGTFVGFRLSFSKQHRYIDN